MARWWWYGLLVALAAGSVWCSVSLRVDDWLKQMVALPAVGALFAALFQLLRDSAAAQNDRLRQDRDHAFTLAATSHMAQTLFNKHVEFAEAYVDATLELLGKIFQDGPTVHISGALDPLRAIRRKYRLWLTTAVTERLDAFEDDVQEMGVQMGRYSVATAPHEVREASWEKAHNLFSEVLGIPGSTSERKAASYVVAIEHLQTVLGIGQLTERRDQILGKVHS